MGIYAVKDTGGKADKIDIIIDAYSQLRISGITVQPTPSDLQTALIRLENMAAQYETRNVCMGYNFEDSPDPNSDLGVIRGYWHALATNLAVRLIPDFNKVVPIELSKQASASFSAMSGAIAMDRIQRIQYPERQPVGSGNSIGYNRWARFYRTSGNTPNKCETKSMFIGDINDFTEHFDSYLKNDEMEIIQSFDIVADNGLNLISSSSTDDDIMYRLEAVGANETSSNNNLQITIVVTTSLGRVITRKTIFNLTSRD